MNTALFTSVFGSRVRLRPAKDAFESQYGVMVEFLDEDGSIRDFEGLERVDALVMALCLSAMATDGLSDVAEVSNLYNDAFQRLDGCMVPAGIRPANLISFPTPGAVTSSLSTASGNAGGELFTPPPAGIVPPPAPPQAGKKDGGLADARAGRYGWASHLEYGKPSGEPAL